MMLCACPKFFARAPVSSLTWIWGTRAGWELLGLEYSHRSLFKYLCAGRALLHMGSNGLYGCFAPVQNFLHGPLCSHARGYGATRQAGSDLVWSTAIVLFWSIYVLAVPFCISDQMEYIVALSLTKFFAWPPVSSLTWIWGNTAGWE